MEIVCNIVMVIVWIVCCGAMLFAIIDSIRIRKEGKRLDTQMSTLIDIKKKELSELEYSNSYKERYKNLVEELERHDILVYELDNDTCILIPRERRD